MAGMIEIMKYYSSLFFGGGCFINILLEFRKFDATFFNKIGFRCLGIKSITSRTVQKKSSKNIILIKKIIHLNQIKVRLKNYANILFLFLGVLFSQADTTQQSMVNQIYLLVIVRTHN